MNNPWSNFLIRNKNSKIESCKKSNDAQKKVKCIVNDFLLVVQVNCNEMEVLLFFF